MNHWIYPGLDIIFLKKSDRQKYNAIIKRVCDVFEVGESDIHSTSRYRMIIEPRHCIMYLCWTLTDLPVEKLGLWLGNRHHTTVLSGRVNFRNLCQTHSNLRNLLKVVCSGLGVAYERIFTDRIVSNNVTKPFMVLSILFNNGPLRSSKIKELSPKDVEINLNRILNDLYRIGFIERTPSLKKSDVYDYNISAKGIRYLERCMLKDNGLESVTIG